MPNPLAFTLKASAAETATDSSAVFDLLDPAFAEDELPRRLAELMIEVTAATVVSEAPELIATVQTSPNPSSFQDVLSFRPFADVGYQRLKFATLERYVKLAWTITAGDEFTFSVKGHAHLIYADHDDFFGFGLPRAAVPDETDPVDLLASSLLGASSLANAKIPRAHTLPLKPPYPESLRLHVAKLAAYKFLSQVGFDPDKPADKEVKAGHDDAEEWLDMLGGGVEPDWVDATPEVYDAGAGTASGPRRDVAI